MLRLFILTLFIFDVTLLTTLFLLVSARASPSTSCRTDTHISSTDTLPHSLIIYSTWNNEFERKFSHEKYLPSCWSPWSLLAFAALSSTAAGGLALEGPASSVSETMLSILTTSSVSSLSSSDCCSASSSTSAAPGWGTLSRSPWFLHFYWLDEKQVSLHASIEIEYFTKMISFPNFRSKNNSVLYE